MSGMTSNGTIHTTRHSARQSQNPRPNDAIFSIEHLHAAIDSATYAQNDRVRIDSARQSQNPRLNDAIFSIEHLHAAIDSATYAQNDGVRAPQ